MERLTALYPNESVKVLVDNCGTDCLLLVGSRHVKYEKTDLSFLDSFKLKIHKDPTFEEIANKVREKYLPFYATDIDSIQDNIVYYVVNIKPNIYIHFGKFKIYKEL